MAADPAEHSPPQYTLREKHAVALFEPGDEGHNTLVLGGLDVVVPVEMDLDGDPLQDDAVSLRGAHGTYDEVLTVGDPDVRPDPDRHLAFYRFRHVPPGLYRVAVRIGGAWVPIGTRLTVRKEGVFWNGTKLEAAAPSLTASEDEARIDELDGDHEDHEGKGCGGCHPEDEDG